MLPYFLAMPVKKATAMPMMRSSAHYEVVLLFSLNLWDDASSFRLVSPSELSDNASKSCDEVAP